MLLDVLGGVFAAATGGGAMGLLGGLLRQGLDYFNKRSEIHRELELLKAKNAHELSLRQKDIDLQSAEAAANFRVIQEEGATTVETERLKAVAASFTADKAAFATGEIAANSPWFIAVDVMRGAIRPVITVLFDMAILAIWVVLMVLLWDHMATLFAAKDQSIVVPLMKLLTEITLSIVFLGVTATSYWFVARPAAGARQ